MADFIGSIFLQAAPKQAYSGDRTKKRHRANFTKKALQVLEKCFKQNPYLTSTLRNHLCLILGYTSAQVRVWYQNRRMRMKKKLASKGEDNSDSFENPASKNLLAKIRSRRHKKFRKCSGSCMSSPNDSTNDSTNIEMNVQNNASHSSSMDPRNVTNAISPKGNTWTPQSNSLYTSASIPSADQGSALASTHQQRLQFHHSLYVDSPNPPLVNSNTMHGNNRPQNEEFRHAPHFNNQMEMSSMKGANEFNIMHHAIAHGNQNLDYQAQFNQRKYANYGEYSNDPHSNQPVNLSSQYTYKEENSDIRNPPDEFDRLKFARSNPNSETCFTGYGTTCHDNPYERGQMNVVKSEFPRYPLGYENSGSSQNINQAEPNHFNWNFPAPNISANTLSNTYSSTPFKQVNLGYSSGTATSCMFQNNYQQEYGQNQFMVSQNAYFPGLSREKSWSYPSRSDYVSPMPDEQKNHNVGFWDNSNINSYSNFPPNTCNDSLKLYNENLTSLFDRSPDLPQRTDTPNWEQIFSASLRLEDAADPECSAQLTNDSSQQQFL